MLLIIDIAKREYFRILQKRTVQFQEKNAIFLCLDIRYLWQILHTIDYTVRRSRESSIIDCGCTPKICMLSNSYFGEIHIISSGWFQDVTLE